MNDWLSIRVWEQPWGLWSFGNNWVQPSSGPRGGLPEPNRSVGILRKSYHLSWTAICAGRSGSYWRWGCLRSRVSASEGGAFRSDLGTTPRAHSRSDEILKSCLKGFRGLWLPWCSPAWDPGEGTRYCEAAPKNPPVACPSSKLR